MTPTPELIIKLRVLINDRDKETFTDEELDGFLKEADCIYCAASQAWLIKSMTYETTVGENYEYKTGQESYKRSNIKDMVSIAYQNSDKFKDMCTNKSSINTGFIFKMDTEIEL